MNSHQRRVRRRALVRAAANGWLLIDAKAPSAGTYSNLASGTFSKMTLEEHLDRLRAVRTAIREPLAIHPTHVYIARCRPMTHLSVFSPDWLSPPGETVADLMQARRLSADALAVQLKTTTECLAALLAGRAELDSSLALKLAGTLGGSADFWLSREALYRDALLRLNSPTIVVDAKRWIEMLPLRDMVRFGWVAKERSQPQQVAALLRFFDTETLDSWYQEYQQIVAGTSYKKSATHVARSASLAAWLRRGAILASSMACSPWNGARFGDLLPELRALTRQRDPASFLPTLQSRCAECGVAVVVARAPAGCTASGATRFTSPNQALLLLSFRHLSDDHFWFAFFHEAAHLILHSPDSLYVEASARGDDVDEAEIEADEYAESLLLPDAMRARLTSLPLDTRSIVRFARDAGISPGIVVGQLQYRRRLPFGHMNSLKRRYAWSDA